MDNMYWDGIFAVLNACATSVVFWVVLVLALVALYAIALGVGLPTFGLLTIKNAEAANETPSTRFWAAGYMAGMGTLVFGAPVAGLLLSTLASICVFIFMVMYAYA